MSDHGDSRLVTPLSPSCNFGAQVTGIDLAQPLSMDDALSLQGLLDEYAVLNFPGQDLPPEAQAAVLARMVPEGERTSDDVPEGAVLEHLVSNRDEDALIRDGDLRFHMDRFWMKDPYTLTSLYAMEIEQPCAPTIFASNADAYDRLPPEIRERIESLEACNTLETRSFETSKLSQDSPEYRGDDVSVHPVVYTHPRSRRKQLFVCEFLTDHILDMPRSESDALLSLLFSYLYDEQHLLVKSWENGDFVVWDNYAVQHARQNVEGAGPARRLRKVSSGVTEFRGADLSAVRVA